MVLNTIENLLSLKDVVVVSFWIIMLYLVCYLYRSYFYRGTVFYKYFVWAWTARVFGTIASVLLYDFYFKGGDTFQYMLCTNAANEAFWTNQSIFWDIIFSSADDYSLETWNFLWDRMDSTYRMNFYGGDTGYVIKAGSLFSIFTFNSYFSIALFFSFLSFLGCWKLFRMFYEMYPHLHYELAISILFIPSVFFWGSGFMKDPLCLAALGFLSYASFELLIKKRKILKNVFVVLFSINVIIGIKIYILIAYLPAILIWLLIRYRSNIQSRLIKKLMIPVMLVGIVVFGGGALKVLSSINERYSMDGILNTAVITSQYIKSVNEKKGLSGGYDLGDFEPTVSSALAMIPKGIVVTLYRPFLWETNSPAMLLTAIESFITLLFTLYVFIRVGIFRFFRISANSPEVLFCLIFAIIFAGAIGISTYNFGSLARYKLPLLPFYYSGLIILLHLSKNKVKKLKTTRT